jgi:hypothetical protein
MELPEFPAGTHSGELEENINDICVSPSCPEFIEAASGVDRHNVQVKVGHSNVWPRLRQGHPCWVASKKQRSVTW